MPDRISIESMGVYLPDKRLTTEELVEGCRIKPAFDVEALTGIRERRVAGDGVYALDLAKGAIEKCLEISRHSLEEIDMLVCANISRVADSNWKVPYEPSSSMDLISHFGFEPRVHFDVTSACAGMFMGVLLADSFIKAGMAERAMVVSGEYITHATRTAQLEIKHAVDPLFLSFTLGDSGAAVILEKSGDGNTGFHDIEFYTAARHCNLCTGGWVEGDYGGFVGIADSKRLLDYGKVLGAEMVAKRIKGTPWENSEYQYGIFHQPALNPVKRIAKAVNDLTGKETFTKENLIHDVAERGNTNSTSNFVALWDAILGGTIGSGDNVLFCALGSGITLGVAPYTLDDLPARILAAEKACN